MNERLFDLHMAAETIHTAKGPVEVCGAVSPGEIRSLRFDPGLRRFRTPEKQQLALAEISELPQGGVFLARREELIVGYCTFHPPDQGTRWGDCGLPFLLEMGAIEVSPEWRYCGIGKTLLSLGFQNDRLEDFIVISTEYWWHWDLSGSEMELWEYRAMLADVMKTVGLVERVTDDPDVTSHPANMLSARIGRRVSVEHRRTFATLCDQGRLWFA